MSAKRSALKPLSQSNNKRRRPPQRRRRPVRSIADESSSDDSSDDDILWTTNLSKPKPSGEKNRSRIEMATTSSPKSSTRTSARTPSRVSYSPNVGFPRNDTGNRTQSTQKKESPNEALHDNNNNSSDEVDEQQSVASDDTEALMKRIMVNKVTNTTSTPTLRGPGEDTALGNSIPSDSINDSHSPLETDHNVRHPTSEWTATASNVEHTAKEEQPQHHVSKDDNDDGNDDKSNTTAEPEHDNDQSSVDTAVLMGRLLDSQGGPTKSTATLEQDSVSQKQARLSAIPEAHRQPEVEPFVPHAPPTQPPLLDTTNPPLVDDDYVLPEMSDDSSISSSSSSDESENDQSVEKTIVQTTPRHVNDLTVNKSDPRNAPIPSSSRQNRPNLYTASQPQYPSNTGHSTLTTERTIPPANTMAQGSGSAKNQLGNEIRDTPQGVKKAVPKRPTVYNPYQKNHSSTSPALHNPYLTNHSSTSPTVHNPYLKNHSSTSPTVHNPYLKNHSSTSPAVQAPAIPKKSTPCAAVDAKVSDEATVMEPAAEPCPSWLDDDQLAEAAFLGTDTPSEHKRLPQEGANRTVRQGLRSPAPTFQVGRIRRSLEQHRAQVFGQNDDIEEVLEDDMEAEAFGFSAETAIEVDDPPEIQQPMIASYDHSSTSRTRLVHDGDAENRHSWPPTNSIQNNRPRLPIPEEWSTSNKRRKIRDPKATNIALASSAVGWSTTASPTPPVPQPPPFIHGSTGPNNHSEYQQITLTTNSLSTQRNDLRGGSGVGAGQYQIVNSYNDEEEDVWNAPPARSSSRGRGKRGRGGGRSQRSGRGRGRGGRGRGRGGRGRGGRGGRNSSFRGRGGNAWSDYGQTSPWTSRSTTDNSMIGHVGGAEISF